MKHPTTNPLAFFVHALLSLFLGALGAAFAAGVQLAGNGPFDLHKVIIGAITAFSAWFGAGFVMLEKSPQTQAALSEAQQQVLARVDALQQSHSGLVTQVGQLIGHIRQLSAIVATPAPAAVLQTTPAQQSAPVQIAPNPAFSATSANPSFLQTVIPANQAAQVPQQPFPPLNRWGTAEVPTQQG